MWATKVSHNGAAPRPGHARKDSAMDDELAKGISDTLKQQDAIPRNDEWTQRVDHLVRSKSSLGSGVIGAHKLQQAADVAVDCRNACLLEQLPVHLQGSFARSFSVPAAACLPPAAAEPPCELSPERIRHPRDRPRGRQIKPSTRRSLMSALNKAATEDHCGTNVGTVVQLDEHAVSPATKAKAQRSIFDWSTFSFKSHDDSAAEKPTASAAQSSNLSAEDSVAMLEESGWTSSTADTTLPNPNDSCLDIHDDLPVPSRRTSATECPKPTQPCIPLSHLLAVRQNDFSMSEIQTVAWAVTSTLDVLHRQGSVHRWVCLDSILVDNLENITCCRLRDSQHVASTHLSATRFCDSRVVLPPCFAAPEVVRSCRGSVPYSPASDMWSLGAVLLAMACPGGEELFGSKAFQGRGAPAINCTMDNLQGWIEMQLLKTFSRLKAPGVQNCIQMLMRADPAQRSSSTYLMLHPWVVSNMEAGSEADAAPVASSSQPCELTGPEPRVLSRTLSHRSVHVADASDRSICPDYHVDVTVRVVPGSREQVPQRDSSCSCFTSIARLGGWWCSSSRPANDNKKNEDLATVRSSVESRQSTKGLWRTVFASS